MMPLTWNIFDQQVFEEPDLDLLLDNDEQWVLQMDDSFADLIDRWHDNECDCPPLGGWWLEVHTGIYVLDDLALVQDVKLEHAVRVRPLICVFGAHFTIHIHDELLMATQVHSPLVDDFNPLPILKQGNCVLDDNVNLMR